jgi:hypothetical protein
MSDSSWLNRDPNELGSLVRREIALYWFNEATRLQAELTRLRKAGDDMSEGIMKSRHDLRELRSNWENSRIDWHGEDPSHG